MMPATQTVDCPAQPVARWGLHFEKQMSMPREKQQMRRLSPCESRSIASLFRRLLSRTSVTCLFNAFVSQVIQYQLLLHDLSLRTPVINRAIPCTNSQSKLAAVMVPTISSWCWRIVHQALLLATNNNINNVDGARGGPSSQIEIQSIPLDIYFSIPLDSFHGVLSNSSLWSTYFISHTPQQDLQWPTHSTAISVPFCPCLSPDPDCRYVSAMFPNILPTSMPGPQRACS